MGIGHDMERETHLMKLDEFLVEGRLPKTGTDEALVGYELAAELGLSIGDELFIVANTSYGGLGPGLYEIVGLMKTGIPTLDKKSFHVPLEAVQYQLAMEDMAVDIAMAFDGGTRVANEMQPKVQAVLDSLGRDDVVALTWREASIQAGMLDPAEQMAPFMMMLVGIVALTTVVNTVLMSVMERIREFGALRALGFTRAHVMRIVLFETVLLGIVGTAVGLGVGMGIAKWLNITGIDFSSSFSNTDMLMAPIIHPVPDASVAMYSAFFGAIISLIAAWYPARVAVRVAPATALGRQQ